MALYLAVRCQSLTTKKTRITNQPMQFFTVQIAECLLNYDAHL